MKEGDVIADRYRLVRAIGQGGMGVVWLAEHATLKTSFAIKVLHANLARGDVLNRFNREAQIAARLKSPNVVQVFDHGVMADGAPFIAMEWLEGESVRDRITRLGRLGVAETARLVRHVCRALSRAHEAGLIHRDLKPENLFVVSDGDEEIVKVLDFGVAKATDALAYDGVDPTRTGALIGTPFYMSPEQAMGLKEIDATTDLWALGTVVIECLTGKRAFTAPALGPLVVKICGTYMPLPSTLAPDANISADIDAWVARALERDRSKRFASAREASDAFMVASGTADSLTRSGTNLSTPTPSEQQIPAPDPFGLADTMAKRNSAQPPEPVMTLPLASTPSPPTRSTPSVSADVPTLKGESIVLPKRSNRAMMFAIGVVAAFVIVVVVVLLRKG